MVLPDGTKRRTHIQRATAIIWDPSERDTFPLREAYDKATRSVQRVILPEGHPGYVGSSDGPGSGGDDYTDEDQDKPDTDENDFFDFFQGKTVT